MNCLTIVVICLIGSAFCGETKTETCQEHRERVLKSTAAAKLVPECDSNGDYIPLACYNETNGNNFCSCFTKTGEVAKSPSQDVKRCECYLKLHEGNNPPRIGAFIPTCESDGSFSKKQCHGSTGMCWCSHPNGDNKTEPTRESLSCE